MAWYDDLSGIVGNKSSTSGISRVSGFDTSINTSGLNDINTDFSDISSGITEAGRGITKDDIIKFNINRPDNEYEGLLNKSISGLQDYAAGTSKIDRTIANQYLNKFDASTAANTMAQAQRIASQPFITEGAKNAALMEMQRTAGSQKSQLIGELAKQSQERAFTASQKLTDVLQNAANYKEEQFRTALTSIGSDLDRELQAKISTGEITIKEASMQLEKYGIELNAVIQGKQLELTKLTGLDNFDIAMKQLGITEDELKIKAAELGVSIENLNNNKLLIEEQIADMKIKNQNANIDMWQPLAINLIMELKGTNPDATVEDVKNDQYTYQACVNTYQSIMQTKDTPSDDWIQSLMSKVKTQAEVEEELTEARLNSIKDALIESGVESSVVDEVTTQLKLYQATDGLYQVNDDRSVSLLGVDGKPIKIIGRDLEESVENLTSDQIKSRIESSFQPDYVEELITNINDEKITNTEELLGKIKNKYGSQYEKIDENMISKFFDNVKNGNIQSTKITEPEITFSGDVWGTTANKILESTNKEDNINKQYVIDERVNEFINDSELNKKVTNKDIYNKLKENSSVWEPSIDQHSGSVYSEFTNSMDIGSLINLDDKVYRVSTNPTRTRNGPQHIYLYDFNNGKTVVLESTNSKTKPYVFIKT